MTFSSDTPKDKNNEQVEFKLLDIHRIQKGTLRHSHKKETTKKKGKPATDCLKHIIDKKGENFFYILTNKGLSQNKSIYYSLYFDQEKINLVEKTPVSKKESNFKFKEKQLEINGNKTPANFIEDFNQKIDKIMSDLKTGKASLWEPSKKNIKNLT